MAIIEPIPLNKMFALWSKYGDEKSNGTQIILSQCDKWMKQANVFNKQLTTTDTGLCFNKFKSRAINYNDFLKYIEDLAHQKNVDLNAMKDQLMCCGLPGVSAPPVPGKPGAPRPIT